MTEPSREEPTKTDQQRKNYKNSRLDSKINLRKLIECLLIQKILNQF